MNFLKFILLLFAMSAFELFIPFGHWANMCITAVALYKLASSE